MRFASNRRDYILIFLPFNTSRPSQRGLRDKRQPIPTPARRSTKGDCRELHSCPVIDAIQPVLLRNGYNNPMSISKEPFTFRPPARRKGLRLAIGGLLTVLAVGAAGFGVGLVWLQRTMVYEIRDNALTVTRGFAVTPKVEAAALDTIERAELFRLEPGKRTVGTSLPGYCAGSFTFPELGKVHLASNCSREAVVVTISGHDRPWVLTPADRQGFLSALAGAGLYHEDLQTGDDAPTGWWIRLLMLAFFIPTLMVPLLFFVAPARLCYRVTPSTIEVETTLFTKRFTVSNCIARIYRPEESAKLLGSSMPGFYSGRFAIDGMTTRVYVTHLDEGVLVEGPDLRLLVSPEDPHAFLEALRARAGVPVE